ncbi:MAG: glycosyltransferase family 2 protein [Lachnospiraceae bacterium]|nr:glycosyltransferase family 2 protein [Lachnospiraceae bacterium]
MFAMIKVSVIIPVYNSERFLRDCLESVMGQTLNEIEVICVDDGSTDTSEEILEEYAKRDRRILLLRQEHKGGGYARNLGIGAANGEYLSFLDSDDFFEPDMLEEIYLRCKSCNADIGVYGVQCYHEATGAENDEPSGLRKEFLPEKEIFSWKDIPDHIFNTFHNWPWNKLFRHDFVKRNKLRFQEIWRTNDLLFTAKALILAERIVAVDKPLIHYRIQTHGNCQSTNSLYPFSFYTAFKALKDFLKEYGIWNEVRCSYQNHALDGCIANLDSLEFGKSHRNLYEQLKTTIFDELELNTLKEEDVFSINKEKFKRMWKICDANYLDYVLDRADAYRKWCQNLQFSSYRSERMLERCIEEERAHKNQMSDQIQKLQQELDRLVNTKTFKAGRLIMYLPQKIYCGLIQRR